MMPSLMDQYLSLWPSQLSRSLPLKSSMRSDLPSRGGTSGASPRAMAGSSRAVRASRRLMALPREMGDCWGQSTKPAAQSAGPAESRDCWPGHGDVLGLQYSEGYASDPQRMEPVAATSPPSPARPLSESDWGSFVDAYGRATLDWLRQSGLSSAEAEALTRDLMSHIRREFGQ